jgi:hypothetical protein
MAKGKDFDLESFNGLFVKISNEVVGDVGGKRYMIPESALPQFLVNPKNRRELDETLNGSFDNVDYAIFREDMIMKASGG